jgi:hypothetical protein
MHDLPAYRGGVLERFYQNLSRYRITVSRLYPTRSRFNLTIGRDPMFVWYRIAKTGTRSVFHALREAGVQFEIENGIFLHDLPNLRREHFRFSFVRNPWVRFISCFHDRVVDRNHFGFSPEEHARMKEFPRFLDYVETLDINRCDVHLRMQSRMIDLEAIHFLGRMERFEEDLAEIFAKMGLPCRTAPQKNVSSRTGHGPESLTEDQVARIGNLYRRDVQIFGYSCPRG